MAAIVALRPDLVVANEEENRAPDLAALRAAGIEVLTTEVRSLDQAFAELHRVLVTGCGLARPRWLDEAEAAWAALPPPDEPRRAIVPIWRRPWMVIGCDTFMRRSAGPARRAERVRRSRRALPRIPLDELNAAGADLVVLPDEPYRFTASDGPEAFPALPAALVDGRYLTWYGPSLAGAPAALRAALR